MLATHQTSLSQKLLNKHTNCTQLMGNFLFASMGENTIADSPQKRKKEVDDDSLVQQCLLKLQKLRGYTHLDEEEQIEMAKCLALKHNLLDMYLDKNFVASTKMLNKLAATSAATSSSTSGGIMSSYNSTAVDNSVAESVVENVNDIEMVNDIDDIDDIDLERMKNEVDVISKHQRVLRDEEFLRVKLVIVESQQGARKTFRRVLSPVMNAFDVAPQFGLFHS
jgi:hypothetical protein